jgi:hypothetical protein
MTDPAVPEPIIVNPTAGPDQWAAGIRYALMTIAGAASVFGWEHVSKDATGLLVIAMPLGGLIALWGQYKTRQQSLKLAVLAKAVPDTIAQVKGEMPTPP